MLAVANFHYIRPDFKAVYPSIFGVTPAQFDAQLDMLAQQGEFISQQELIKFTKRPFDRNYILITFDDGLQEQFEYAKPILDKKGIPYIFFINTSVYTDNEISLVHKIHLLRSKIAPEELNDIIANKFSTYLDEEEKAKACHHYNYDTKATACLKYMLNFRLGYTQQHKIINPLFDYYFDEKSVLGELYLNLEQITTLANEGVLGSHGHYHNPLAMQDKENLKTGLKVNQNFFMDNFGSKAISISYPYGSYEASVGVQKEIRKAGFKMGFSMERAVNNAIIEQPLLIARFDCNDLPGGKSNLFEHKNIFKNPPLRNWI